MLPGGLCVLGLYAFCTAAAFRAAQPLLQNAACALPATDSADVLLLHADSASRGVYAAKRCAPPHARSRPRAWPTRSASPPGFGAR